LVRYPRKYILDLLLSGPNPLSLRLPGVPAASLILAWFALAGPVGAQVQFPGPVRVELPAPALSSATAELDVGQPAYLVNGSSAGVLTLHRLGSGGARFIQLTQFLLGGELVDMIPWEGRPLLDPGLVVATTNPDRVAFLGLSSRAPYFTLEDVVLLEEDPGTLAFVGNPLGARPELAVSLPGIDQVVFLEQAETGWAIKEIQDSGDRPQSIVGVDIDGDQVRELVTANRGPLSGTLGIYRRDPQGSYVGSQQVFPAGIPTRLASYDFDGDGRAELAATVEGVPVVILMRGSAGQLEPYDTLNLTLPADGVHLTGLFDGTPGLFASNSDRGLVEFFQNQAGSWLRRNSYYPGCHPLATLSGDFNGDGGRDLVSVGGDADAVTVMFANPQPGFWGYPALALNASPGASVVADFDGDGLPDLTVSNGDQPLLSFFPGLPGGGFRIFPTDLGLTFYPGSLALLESDDDPGPELAVLDAAAGEVVVMDYVTGVGFAEASRTATGRSPGFLSAPDMDMDGIDDLLVITREVDEVRILYGAGQHAFTDQVALGLENFAAWAEPLDLNADGLPDLALSDGLNRVFTTVNQGGRAFGPMDWLNAGSGAGIMAAGDLDQDQDEDLVVVNESDESLTLFENTGSGKLTRRIGAFTLSSAPTELVITDLDQNGLPDLVMNLREDKVLGVSFALDNWVYLATAAYDGGPDVAVFTVGDFNLDDVPDILTLNRSLMLGLTLLNVEQELVAVHPEALAVSCGPRRLELRIMPDRTGPWTVAFGHDGRWQTLAVSGQALLGEIDYDRGVWLLAVDPADLPGPTAQGVVRLTVGEENNREWLDVSLEDVCGPPAANDLPLVAWTREPWPNPFNPRVNARFALAGPARVTAGVFDLAGRRVALLADGMYPAGDHQLQWDGKTEGRHAAAGVYLLRISTPEKSLHHKILLLK